MVVTLIGYRGSGKSSVAAPLAVRLGWKWIDADDEIEQRAGATIREIFETDGESHFRRLERDVLLDLLSDDQVVIAAGGGAVLNSETRRDLQAAGPVVWLQASCERLANRIDADQSTAQRRPNLTAGGGQAEIEQLLTQREPLYRECASVTIQTDGKSIKEVVALALEAVEPLIVKEAETVVLFGVPPWIAFVTLFVFGAVIGSFLNVCIYRIPRHEKFWDQLRGLSSPPSHCPACQYKISMRDNVPILGWLCLLGRCRNCRAPISPRYPIIELANGLLFVVVYWFEIPTGWFTTVRESCLYSAMGPQLVDGWSDQAFLHWRFFYHLVLIESLVVATMIDIDLRIIPDGSTLPALAIGLLGALVIGQLYLVPIWSQDPSMIGTLRRASPEWLSFMFTGPEVPAWTTRYPHLHGLAVSVAGMLVGGGAVWAVRLIGFWVLRQEAMGFGDVILMGMIGSFIGWQPVLMVFFIAPACALFVLATAWVVRRPREIPYGPYLSIATLLVLLFWKQLWPAAERWFDLGPLVPITAIFGLAMLGVSLVLVQLIKRILGIPLYPEDYDDFVEEWTPADQLTYQAGENVDRQQGNWKRETWPGTAAGRGTMCTEQWRDGTMQRR